MNESIDHVHSRSIKSMLARYCLPVSHESHEYAWINIQRGFKFEHTRKRHQFGYPIAISKKTGYSHKILTHWPVWRWTYDTETRSQLCGRHLVGWEGDALRYLLRRSRITYDFTHLELCVMTDVRADRCDRCRERRELKMWVSKDVEMLGWCLNRCRENQCCGKGTHQALARRPAWRVNINFREELHSQQWRNSINYLPFTSEHVQINRAGPLWA